ncbi:ATPase, T2SS/T4P/T4SS family [Pelomonas sp. APW6]|uniref:ATPase, T2SS/T4P/T4SS family n=1 Tax=Roseateles subflavus TaxID=3053353 RepID=A0ABT7LN98_9BURK|nr:ATPase, T2SS/T4P/T4SS family [Pelomonas sp. APW6]MDL5034351.1 ATPase, T2SS/T4P/T4SS family [Pelomonas sp. APW6]
MSDTSLLDRPEASASAAPDSTFAAAAKQDAVFGSAAGVIAPYNLDHDFSEVEFDHFIRWASENRASDLTIQSGDFITAQIQGIWRRVTTRSLEHNEVERIVAMKYGQTGPARLDSGEPIDFRLEVVIDRDNVLGYRANATKCRVGDLATGISITTRSIPGLPPKLETLGIEQQILDSLFPKYGLVLVIGTTGSGKSTLLASANRERLEGLNPVKIITYEDPVEYTFGQLGKGNMPMISQVSIGRGSDLKSFSLAGPNAMRRKADVIVMGELRDLESVMAGFEMAETGHAVYATLHVETPAQAVDRIVSFFPVDGQPAAANKLRAALRLIIAQKLTPNLRGTRSAFRSYLVFDREVRAALAAEPFHKWEAMLAAITKQRGGTFEDSAYRAFREKLISFEAFMEVSSMTKQEATHFIQEREAHGA